jgi:RimJ/RimL family protein N-acetyltransferase
VAAGTRLETERLLLEPLAAWHAAEMAAVLDDPELHRHVGGSPATPAELQRRYARQERGASPDGRERWVNWIVRERSSGAAIGYVQATVDDAAGSAEVAWVIGTRFQGRGYASEAAAAMVRRLGEEGVTTVRANIHPGHAASAGVARAVGLEPTTVVVDGEVRWERAGGRG